MTGADGALGPDSGPGWRWDVALSFAGAQRDYVAQVATVLTVRGVRCFFDADEQIELWGKYLAEELPAIYAEQAAAVVVFISAEYAARDWTRLERRAAVNRAVRERREYVLPARFDDTPLPGLLSDMVGIDLQTRTPQQFAAMIIDKLARLAVSASAPSAGTGDPARDVEPAPPAGAVRAGDVDPRRLGVHAAISVPGVPDEVPPEYVLRDVDTARSGARSKVAAAAERGGFVLLVGGSSVGKTRCAAEAVKALLPDWWLVHPAGADQLAALAQAPSPRMVVWLDELQRYLDGEHGLTGAVIRDLLNPPHPTVIIGTLWPDRYTAYTTLPAVGDADPHTRERQVLDLADVVRVAPAFSRAEQDRAHAAATRDPRLRAALESAGYGLTQTLAAAPQLVAHWQDAQTAAPYAWAVLTAALDVARLGARAPLSADLLRAAAPGYCTSAQQAEAPDNWFDQALTYATKKLHGAAAALSPAGVGMGQVAGYTAADYLIQHATQERFYERAPASTWDAVLSHIGDPADTAQLAYSAGRRLLYRYAIPLYRHAIDAGYGGDARWLAVQLVELGHPDSAVQILRARADAGDEDAARFLVMLLATRGDVDELRAWADAADGRVALWLAMALAMRGDLDGAVQTLRARVDAGDGDAARLLAARGEEDWARQIALACDRATFDEGDTAWVVMLLAPPRGGLDELHARADTQEAWWTLVRGQAESGHTADANDTFAAVQVAERGDLDGLRDLADAGNGYAAFALAGLLAERGDLDGLRDLADAANGYAATRLAGLLAERGDVDGLYAMAAAGDKAVGWLAADLLTKQGREEEAERLRRFGLNPDGSIACA